MYLYLCRCLVTWHCYSTERISFSLPFVAILGRVTAIQSNCPQRRYKINKKVVIAVVEEEEEDKDKR